MLTTETVEKLIQDISETNSILKEIKDGSQERITVLLQTAIQLHSLFGKKAVQQENHQAAAVLSSLQCLITHCQSHDIMTQRIEHVMQIHRRFGEEATHAAADTTYSAALAEILEMQLLQVQDIRRTYMKDVKHMLAQWKHIMQQLTLPAVLAGPQQELQKILRQESIHKQEEHYLMADRWVEAEIRLYALLHTALAFGIRPSADRLEQVLEEVARCYTMQCERNILYGVLYKHADKPTHQSVALSLEKPGGDVELF